MFKSPEVKIAKESRSIHCSTGYWVTRLPERWNATLRIG